MKKSIACLLIAVIILSILPALPAQARPLASTATLQPDGAAGQDTYISTTSTDTNYGDATTMIIGVDADDNYYRGLLKFDLSSIPSGSIINSATLTLSIESALYSTSGDDICLFRQKRDWTESGATWNKYNADNNWTPAGGTGTTDSENVSVGCLYIPESGSGAQDISLNASKIQEMIPGGSFTNNGFILTIAGESYRFYSSDAATAADRPKLVLDYTAPTSTPTTTATHTATITPTPTTTETTTPTVTHTPTVTPTTTATSLPTDTVTPTVTTTGLPTDTVTPTVTATGLPTDTVTPTVTATGLPADTVTPTPTNQPGRTTITLYGQSDVTIVEELPDTNFTGEPLCAINMTATSANGLINFQLSSSLPAGVTIISALLKMRIEIPGDSEIERRAILVNTIDIPWAATTATWNSADTQTQWSNPGGDYGTQLAMYQGSYQDPLTSIGVVFSASELQGLVDNPGADNGFILRSSGAEGFCFYNSASEYPPELIITYETQAPTITPTPTWSNPPTPVYDNTITYGEIAVFSSNIAILVIVTLISVFYFITTLVLRKRG